MVDEFIPVKESMNLEFPHKVVGCREFRDVGHVHVMDCVCGY